MKSDEYRQQERAAIAQLARDVETFVRMFYESQINQQAFMTEAYRLLQAQAFDVENIRGQAYTGETVLKKLDEVMERINSMPELLRAEPGIIGWPGEFGGTSTVLPPTTGGMPGPAKHGEPGAGGFSGGYMPETGGMPSGMGGMSGSIPGAGMPGGMGGMSGSIPGAGMPSGMGGMSGSVPAIAMPSGMGGMSGSVPGSGMPSGMGGMSGSVPGAGMPSGFGGMSGSVPGAGMPGGMGGMSGSVPGAGMPGGLGGMSGSVPGAGMPGGMGGMSGSVPGAGMPGGMGGMSGSVPGAGMPSGMGGMSPTMPGTSHTFPGHMIPGSSHTMPSTSHTMPSTSHTMPSPSPSMPSTSYTIPGTSYKLPGTSPTVPTPGQESVPVPLGDHGPEAVPVIKPEATKQAEVRFLHASPDASAVDLYVDHRKVAANVSYHTLSHYMPIETGRHRVQGFPHGVAVGALIDHTVDFKPGRHYTIAVGGVLKEIRPIVIEDDRTGTKPGFARLKIVHLSPNAPAVDITLPSGKVLIGHLTFKEKSPSIQVAPGTRELDVRLAGKSDVVLKVPKIKFEPNASYTLYITGLAGREPGLHPLVVREHQ